MKSLNLASTNCINSLNSSNKTQCMLINDDDISDKYYDLSSSDTNVAIVENNKNIINNNINNKNDDDNDSIYLIKNLCTTPENADVSDFITFCLKNGLFDDTFYDYNNNFSIMATKLHLTYEQLSNEDYVNKKTFINTFKKKFGYMGNISFIYKCIDCKNNGKISWEEFINFFLPYIKYITL